MAFRTKRPVDMPMVAHLMREKKGQYVAIISFAQSKRHYQDELIFASSLKEARTHLAKLYPTIKWSK